MPIQNLIDYLEGGDSIDEFLEDFPNRFSPAGDFVSGRGERKRAGARCVNVLLDECLPARLARLLTAQALGLRPTKRRSIPRTIEKNPSRFTNLP